MNIVFDRYQRGHLFVEFSRRLEPWFYGFMIYMRCMISVVLRWNFFFGSPF